MLEVATVCSGIGAPEKALTNLQIPYRLSYFCEIDAAAAKAYCAIHSVEQSKNIGDMTKVDPKDLPHNIDLIIGGTPCQDFSTAGNGKGGEEGSGTRSSIMWYYVRIIEETKPKIIIWENVPAVLSDLHISNYRKFYFKLSQLGYRVYSKTINAKYFNVPQNRSRVFVVAIRKDNQLPFSYPIGYDSGIRIRDILIEVAEEYYIKTCDDFVLTNCAVSDSTHEIIVIGRSKNTIFKQNNQLLSIEGISDCLTTKVGNYIYDNRVKRTKPIRRFTPQETFRIMGFGDEDYFKCVKAGIARNKFYMLSGNSMAVPVLMGILGQLYKVPDWEEKVFQERYLTFQQRLEQMPLFRFLN